MIKYVKLKDSTELPCLSCGKTETNIFLVEDIENNKKKKSYMCEDCFKSFKTQIPLSEIKEYFESDLSKILSSKR